MKEGAHIDAAIDERDSVISRTAHAERPRLLRFIRRRVRNEADAEDILQDVFTQLASGYDITEPIERVTSWLFAAARNRIIDWYRRKKPGALPDSADGVSFDEAMFDGGHGPDETADQSLIWEELDDALEDLPEEQRDVFTMHEIEGRSFKEIAELTGVGINTLLSRKRYAVLFLRSRLQDLFDEIQDF